jgi:hypothetical protein
MCTSLSSVVIPNVVNIASYAFYNKTSLRSIYLPSSVASIGDGAFLYSAYTCIDWDDSVVRDIAIDALPTTTACGNNIIITIIITDYYYYYYH